MTAKLVSKHENRLVVERTYVPFGAAQKDPARVQEFLVEAMIDPAEHPFTSPAARRSSTGRDDDSLDDQTLSKPHDRPPCC